ncbi:glycosyltransferase family 87 protein [Noviherbaspirillum pedocola]|uniref:DUF2029 domain-containing protein n=1 Tax=Noviherbaspirillum pedocola TaxID=2801341 RepID=A0A934W4F4_9BURK|nr:glycosyltransferase family 87 protein [Noviherbaspirillum pedocola]MBK4733827.1 DUF2029 domain-containing protein [Noviherbaspirillum pedocola]
MTSFPWIDRNKLIILGIAHLLLIIFTSALRFRLDEPDGMKVFGAYWASGQALMQGMNPFGIYPLTWSRFFNIPEVNLNPPTILPLFYFIGHFPPVFAARVWTLISGIVLIIAILWLFVDRRDDLIQRRQMLWVFFLPSLASTLVIGQIYIFIFAMVTAAWICLKRGHERVAGVIIGIIVAVKPNLAVWPFFLLIAEHWRPVRFALLAGASAAALSLNLYGINAYKQWHAAVAADTHAARFLIEVSIHGFMTRLGAPAIGTALAGILLATTTVLVWRQRFSKIDTTRLALIVAILASPIAWVDYAMFLIPAMIMRPWNRTLTLAAILLLVPVSIPNMLMDGPIWKTIVGGSIYFTAILLIFIDIMRDITRTTIHHSDASEPKPPALHAH